MSKRTAPYFFRQARKSSRTRKGGGGARNTSIFSTNTICVMSWRVWNCIYIPQAFSVSAGHLPEEETLVIFRTKKIFPPLSCFRRATWNIPGIQNNHFSPNVLLWSPLVPRNNGAWFLIILAPARLVSKSPKDQTILNFPMLSWVKSAMKIWVKLSWVCRKIMLLCFTKMEQFWHR